MGFRQHNKDSDKLWRKRNRSLLIAAGLPDVLVDDERRWTYVLLHGDDELESGWSVSWITDAQAADMLKLLESQYKEQIGLDLLDVLRRRLGVDSP